MLRKSPGICKDFISTADPRNGNTGALLTADKDNKIWMVSNPETLSGIDGRHVKVKALVDVSQSQIRIVSVSEIADEQTGVRLRLP